MTRTIAGRYELIERVGSGGMATVWRARDTSLGREVAVKLMHPHLASNPNFVERFRREARAAAGLSHHGIVAVYDAGSEPTPDGAEAYIVMEYVPGRTLHRVLKDEGPLSVARTAKVGRAVLGALGHAHSRGLVHRDIKPANIIVSTTGDVKVMDFGIAKAIEDATSALTQTGTLMGTASYLSPEQASGHPAGPQSDLYSLGCVLYECLTGSPPFRADTPVALALAHQRAPIPKVREARPDVPPAFAAIVTKALAKEPARRFASARDMAAAVASTRLESAPDEAPTVVHAVSNAPTIVATPLEGTQVIGTRPPPPNRMPAVVRWVGVALLLGLAAWLLAFALADPEQAEVTPSPAPTLEPVETPAPETPPPTPSPEPEPTPPPETPQPTPPPTEFLTPRPPRTPDVPGGFPVTPTPTQATAEPTPTAP